MGVVLITVVMVVDRHKALPDSSIDVDGKLWEFLGRLCFVLASEPLGIPIVVRSADLYKFSSSLLALPKACRPIVRTRGATAIALERNGVIYQEDRIGISIEWLSVLSGYNYLNSSIITNRPYHLWVLGAADLCRPVFNLIPGPKRIVYVEIEDEFNKSWQPSFVCGKLFETIPLTTVDYKHLLKQKVLPGQDHPESARSLLQHKSSFVSPPPNFKRLIYAVVDPMRLQENLCPQITNRTKTKRRSKKTYNGLFCQESTASLNDKMCFTPQPSKGKNLQRVSTSMQANSTIPPSTLSPRAAARKPTEMTWKSRLLGGVFDRTARR
ncbi:virion protein US2 [Equid alphaherpesvirus 4]|uniref:ORF68 n=1 Tax=Equid alphaherpesvirus 4 TaxID=10331 RepID=W8DLQ5_9ALPH|nr:ORF68 [Equid alphaherpesvirus 4]AMB15952.1 virion protein US2 [Equid alphaherpesvirus 4]AMB16031.1 virion protein US2 [Equid alphaherpesvirus 4]AMB16663.1 virion protein US2 [Equid alphaherpesvirus 4]AMB16742.1 virion protein US2 [Equid alphaherpesvirus 4]